MFEVETTDGRKIKCTKKHRFLTKRGWKSLEELSINDKILVSDKKKTKRPKIRV